VLLATLLVACFAVDRSRPPRATLAVAPLAAPTAAVSADTQPTTRATDAVAATVTRAHAFGNCGFSVGGPATAAAVGRCTVLEIGDSLGADIGWGLSRQVTATAGLDLVQLDVSSTGLANTSYFDWPARLAADLRQYHPQLVLVCLGGNDQQGMVVGGSAVQFPSRQWEDAYLARVRRLVSEATSAGAFVLWVGLPIMQQPSYSQGADVLNSLYRQAVSSEPHAAFVSTWSLLSNPRGTFESDAIVGSTRTTLRQPDGIHYSFSGEDVVATYVLRELSSIFHVQVSPARPAVVTAWG
jgi:hypothetical protein